jgi:NAD(P)-dependent dehydrogenase (short-subunit alcohol dehydrogenase family)
MTSATTPAFTRRAPELLGQTVVIGGSAGIGLETARRARAEGADVVLTGRNPDRLNRAALNVGAERTAAFDAYDTASLERFFEHLPTPIDHVMVTAGGPNYGPPLVMDAAEVRQAISGHVVLGLEVARHAARKMRPGGPCCRVVTPGAVAALAVHNMSNMALTSPTYDIDGGLQFVW